MFSIINIIILAILFFFVGRHVEELLFGKISNNVITMIGKDNVNIKGVIFLHVLGIIYIYLGYHFENIDMSYGLIFAGFALLTHTSIVYWSDISMLYKFIVLLGGISFILYNVYSDNEHVQQITFNELVNCMRMYFS